MSNNNFITLENYKGSNILKGFVQEQKVEHTFESIEKSLHEGFEKGLISEDLLEKSLEELDLIKGGKRAMVGEIRDFGGKKFKKQPDGKWVAVKEQGNVDHSEKKEGSDSSNKEETHHVKGVRWQMDDSERKKAEKYGVRIEEAGDTEKPNIKLYNLHGTPGALKKFHRWTGSPDQDMFDPSTMEKK